MTDTQTQLPQKKSPRWMKILLVISLSLNLLIIGAIGSRAYFGPAGFKVAGKHGRLASPNAMRHAGTHLMWKLPREKRLEIHQLVRNHKAAMKPQLLALANARANFARTLKTDYKPEELSAALAKVGAAEDVIHSKSTELIKIFIDKLTPQERKKYAAILLSPKRGRWFNRQ